MSPAIHLVCPHCDSINRLPADKPHERGKCGQCHQPLFDGQPVALTANNFQQHITRNDIPVLVDFWAPWCGPCKMMAPVFAQASGQLQPKIRLAKVNTEAEPALAQQYNIRSIPTLAIFKQGRELNRVAGAMDLANLLQFARQFT